MISYIALVVAVVALAGVAYAMFVALPKMGDGMQELGNGLASLGKRVEDFAGFVASKLG